jgi:uncharacterized protein
MAHKKHGGGRRRKATGATAPVRLCAACREPLDKDDGLRFVIDPNGVLVFDLRSKALGRGTWTCADPGCVHSAVKKGGFARSLEQAPQRDADDLVTEVTTRLEGALLAVLGLARKQGLLACGREQAIATLTAPGAKGALLLSIDVAKNTRDELAERVPTHTVWSIPAMSVIAQAVGEDRPVGVLAVSPTMDAPTVRAARRWGAFAAPMSPPVSKNL